MQPSWFEKFPSCYHSPFSEKLKAFIRSPKFGYIISFILIINLSAVIIETTVRLKILTQVLDSSFKVYIKYNFLFLSTWEKYLLYHLIWAAFVFHILQRVKWIVKQLVNDDRIIWHFDGSFKLLLLLKFWLQLWSVLILISVRFQLDIENNSAQKVWQSMEFVLGKGLFEH